MQLYTDSKNDKNNNLTINMHPRQNAHASRTQSQRDDLESVAHMLIYFAKGCRT
jgi:hypothetical protein